MTDEQRSSRADRAGATGRRSDVLRRRVDVVVVLSVVLPALVGIGLGLTRAEDPAPSGVHPPSRARLTDAKLVCPAGAAARAPDVLATRVPGTDAGEVVVRTDRDGRLEAGEPVTVGPDAAAAVPDSGGPVVLHGEGAAAPGLVAGRPEPLTAAECRGPSYDEWFLGLGASATSRSVIELVNPDAGPAVVDLALVGPGGPVEESRLRGVAVPPYGVRTLDLTELAPRRVDVAAHLTITRGRVSASVRHTVDPLGQGRVTTDFLPAQTEPSTENLVLGVPRSGSERVLYVANPGDDEVRARLRVVTGQATFAPAGLEEVVVPPQTMRRVGLNEVLAGDAGAGLLGIQVDASGPVVTGVRAVSRGDVTHLAPTPAVEDEAAIVVPEGDKRLLLGGALHAGTVHVVARDTAGRPVGEEERVEVGAGRAAELRLPTDAVLVTVEPRNTPVTGVVVVPYAGRLPGVAVHRLRPAEVYAEVPVVAPE